MPPVGGREANDGRIRWPRATAAAPRTLSIGRWRARPTSHARLRAAEVDRRRRGAEGAYVQSQARAAPARTRAQGGRASANRPASATRVAASAAAAEAAAGGGGEQGVAHDGFALVPLPVEPRARLRGWSGLFVSPVAVDAVLCGERAGAGAAPLLLLLLT